MLPISVCVSIVKAKILKINFCHFWLNGLLSSLNFYRFSVKMYDYAQNKLVLPESIDKKGVDPLLRSWENSKFVWKWSFCYFFKYSALLSANFQKPTKVTTRLYELQFGKNLKSIRCLGAKNLLTKCLVSNLFSFFWMILFQKNIIKDLGSVFFYNFTISYTMLIACMLKYNFSRMKKINNLLLD